MTQRAVRVEHDQVVAESGRGLSQPGKRRKDQLPLGDSRTGDVPPEVRQHRRRAHSTPLVRRIGEQQHVARLLHGVDECVIRLLPRPHRPAKLEAGTRIGLREVHIVGDDPRRRASQIVDQHRMDRPRPGPASRLRLEIPQRVLVDLDEDDLLARRCGIGRPRHPPVVGLEFNRLERIAIAKRPSQPGVNGEDAQRRGQTDQDSGEPCAHVHQL